MPVLYKLYKLVRTFKDGRTDKANNHWFARSVSVGDMSTDELAKQISYSTTVTPSDCAAVLKALGPVMNQAFNSSRVVVLDGVGRFSVGLKTTGAESAAEFNVAKNIKGIYLNYQPEYKIDSSSRKRVVALLEDLRVQETPLNLVTKD